MFRLPLFVDNDAMGIILSYEEEMPLHLLNSALRVSNKSTYTFWIRYFKDREGKEKGVIEALLSYWLAVHPPKRTGGWDQCLRLSLAICLAKGKKLPLGPLYLGLLYTRFDECAGNIIRPIGRYDVLTSFLQIHVWESLAASS